MTRAQQRASDPTSSVLVSASAGTGKTKVLVDRLIAILYQGTPISHLICLTFTKAAALEMRERLLKRLKDDAEEQAALEGNAKVDTLTANVTNDGAKDQSKENNKSQKAAQIYEALLEAPETLKIMTLHAYCQSLLQKFPFEAGIAPFFDVLDDDKAQQLLYEAMNAVLTAPSNEAVRQAIEDVCQWMGEHTFENCLSDAFSKWHKVRHLARLYPTAEAFEQVLINSFDPGFDSSFAPGFNPNFDSGFDSSIDLIAICDALNASAQAMDKTLAKSLSTALPNITTTNQGLDPSLFLTSEGKPRKKIVSADFKKKHPEFSLDLDDLAQQFHHAHQKKLFDGWLSASKDFWQIVQAVLTHFSMLKTEQNALDYHDLILHSLALFFDDQALSFVHQRLDYTIDHILIDEAQDNSPEQWLLILKLVDLFIREDTPHRSLFVVGDVKQSIYGFQGAAPQLFESLAETFDDLLQSRGHHYQRLTLDDSFRTTPEILKIVDQVFDNNPNGIGAYTAHRAFRQDRGWVGATFISKEDLAESQKESHNGSETEYSSTDSDSDWPIFDTYKTVQSKDAALADRVAQSIEQALSEKWILPSTGQAIEPKDILILVRNRGSIAGEIIRALKQKNIAVEGPDRLNLAARLAIHDVLSVLRFLCLPQDDMSLAHLLKSPFINDGSGFDENALYDLCHGREGYLWQRLCESEVHKKTTTLLKNWLSRVDYERPSFLLRAMLQTSYSAFEKRLGADIHLLFETLLDTVIEREKNHPTLAEVLFSLEQSMPVVKRDPSAPTGVRIMTVHGSKGLEAPLVIVVDRSERVDLAKENLVWPKVIDQNSKNKNNGNVIELFCLKPKATMTLESMQQLRENVLLAMHEEKNRLLYVALTRARDGLCVIGSGNWTEQISSCISEYEKQMGPIQGFDRFDDRLLPINDQHGNQPESLDVPAFNLPPWMSLRFESPKKPILDTHSSSPPTTTIQNDAMKRGETIHLLIETLTKTKRHRWPDIIDQFGKDHGDITKELSPQHIKLSLADCEKIKNLVNTPEFSFLFQDHLHGIPDAYKAWSEIEIMNNGSLYRIDRLIETRDAFWIVDFKTGSKSNKNRYLEQINVYKSAVRSSIASTANASVADALVDRKAQPKPVRAFLFWIDALILEEV